jgi:hypothetical protein
MNISIPTFFGGRLPFVGIIAVLLLLSTGVAFSQDTGHIIVGIITYPYDDPQVFNFDAIGGDYADFSLSGGTGATNDQELAPGTYSINFTLPDGWLLDTGGCPTIELDAGETFRCSYVLEKIDVPLRILDLNVQTSWVRSYNWNLSKEVTPTSAEGDAGATLPFNYTVQVDQTVADSDFLISGTFNLFNPALHSQAFTASAVLGGTLNVEVVCFNGDPTDLVGIEETNPCTLSGVANGPEFDGQNLVLTINALHPNSPILTTTASAVVDWSDTPTTVVGSPTVDVTDNADEPFIDNTWNGVNTNATFNYTQNYTCSSNGSVTLNNTVSIAAANVSDSASVTVNCAGVVEEDECTYGQGYWKNHSDEDAWRNLGSAGAGTTFFQSGMAYSQVLSTPPAGNFYYQLAHQYIEAKLNLLSGASSTAEVNAAIAWAETQFFNLYTPSAVPNNLREQARSYAATLGSYNDGAIGPGDCDE